MLSLRYIIALGIARTTAGCPHEPWATDAAAVTARPPAGRTCGQGVPGRRLLSCRLGERLNANAGRGRPVCRQSTSNPCKMLSALTRIYDAYVEFPCLGL